MQMWCGIDWAERHHDVAVIDDTGQLVAQTRIGDDAVGFRQLLDLLATHGDRCAEPIPVAIETPKGLLPAALRAADFELFPINPLAVSRYRDHGLQPRRSSLEREAVKVGEHSGDGRARAVGSQNLHRGRGAVRQCIARRPIDRWVWRSVLTHPAPRRGGVPNVGLAITNGFWQTNFAAIALANRSTCEPTELRSQPRTALEGPAGERALPAVISPRTVAAAPTEAGIPPQPRAKVDTWARQNAGSSGGNFTHE
jgi:hypothetical protein